LWKLVFSTFVTASSGVPFNIITGLDSNQDRQLTERPSFASPSAICGGDIKCTAFGKFNIRPLAGEQIIPRNHGQGPASLTVNLRITRTFGFVNVHKSTAAAGQGGGKPATSTGGPGGAGARGPMIAGGGGGGGGDGHGPGGGGGGGMGQGGFSGGGGSAEKKFTVTTSFYFQNLFNNVNLAPPIGNLSSPQFGLSQSIAGSFGGFGGGGGGGSANAGNRRIYLNVRLTF
jgi:hypothetical protein